ncbi:unnamed protein product [Caenorhabditis bovis]|uniref:Uncharacterized protein n=1 Tax=Caenorhabditis bovis TaxID=2654633 RepID=A0A8S1EJQ1_9PELO|nr:unnamed protein product [Caenorhabditis bovis]
MHEQEAADKCTEGGIQEKKTEMSNVENHPTSSPNTANADAPKTDAPNADATNASVDNAEGDNNKHTPNAPETPSNDG